MDKVEDHPLAETAGVESDEEVVEERSTRSRSRARDRHAEESDGETPSDRDEGLSEGDSSYGDDSQFAGPPNLQRFASSQ